MLENNSLLKWCEEQGEFGEKIISEWTGLDKDDQEINMNNISKGSHKKMKWRCMKCGNVWITDVHNRTGYKTECPQCREMERSARVQKATTHKGENDLLTWCNSHGEYGQYLLNEWVGKTKEGEKISIDEVARASGKYMQWKCHNCTKIFYSPPSGRTGKYKRGCPNCNTRSTSYPEQFIFYALKSIYKDAVNRGIFKGYEYDIMLPSVSTYIEYSPTYTHANKKERDLEKAIICKKNNIRFIYVIEDSENKLDHYVRKNEICFYLDYNKRFDCMVDICEKILSLLDEEKKLDYEFIDEMAFLRSHRKIEYEESVEYLYPQLVKEWNKDYNNGREARLFTSKSSQMIYWQCCKCGYGKNGEWKALLSNRVAFKQGCPVCGYNWYDNKIHNKSISIVTKGENDLPSQYPKLYEEWAFSYNKDIDPFSLKLGSHKKIYWICKKCGYGENGEWKSALGTRVDSKSGCPACGFNCFDNIYHTTSGTTAVVVGKNDLNSLYPELVAEWDYFRNIQYLPSEMKSKSTKKVYWICRKCGYGSDGEWIARIGDRVSDKTGCPVCGYNCFTGKVNQNGSKVVKTGVNDIASGKYAEILKEWNYKYNDAGVKSPNHRTLKI